MRVPVRVFSTKRIIENSLKDKSFDQAINGSSLPGIVGQFVVMPDVHQGYGFPIGGVAATQYPEGVITPGGIGYDINCGVRLLGSMICYEEIKRDLKDLADALYAYCPSGVGVKGKRNLSQKELESVCKNGSKWLKKNFSIPEADILHTEEEGCLPGVDISSVSKRAYDRGKGQLGSLGSGNHFIEISVIEQVFDTHAASAMGLFEGNITLMIHCGSRGFGHQICSDYVNLLQSAVHKYGIKLVDRELVCAPMNQKEGIAYLSAMRAAANYAFANRQLLTYYARQAFESVLAGKVKQTHLHQIYDVCHNIGKIEEHVIDGSKRVVCVHRKGATRAFGPMSDGIPDVYKKIGQPVIVPGSMGTASWVLSGTKNAMDIALGSSCHGAGRVMSRSKAKKTIRGDVLRKDLLNSGIEIRAGSLPGLAEEAPGAYKDVDEVIKTVSEAGIAKKVARLRPVAVIKG